MERVWWKDAVFYRVYTRSFFDSNGDGVGDIPGIIQKLPYIRDLGADVIWLAPIFDSPQEHGGLDVSDYQKILPEYGTMEDFYELLGRAHALGIRVMLDVVLTSTSDKHAWFRSAKASKRASKRDFYIWQSPRWDAPPNNWKSFFGGSAWTLDQDTGQSYLHLYSPHEPELNWENFKLRQEMHELLRWWLDMGVDGLHFPRIHLLSKPEDLAQNAAGGAPDHALLYNRPATHQYLREMRRKLFARYNIAASGEVRGGDVGLASDYSGAYREELNLVTTNVHFKVDCGEGGRYDPISFELYRFKNLISEWQIGLEGRGWQALFFGDENQPRMVTRFGDDSAEYRERSAKMLATLLLTLKGTPCIYQGDEIGMTSGIFSEISECRDLEAKVFYERAMRDEDAKPSRVMHLLSARGRDTARTPVQWGMSRSAGFTKGEPWIKVNPDHVRLNVALAESDDFSILHYYRRAVAVRKTYPTLVYGKYTPLDDMNGQHFCYLRADGDGTFLILLNFTCGKIVFTVPLSLRRASVEQVLGNYEKEDEPVDSELLQHYVTGLFNPGWRPKDRRHFVLGDEVRLRPYEALVLRIEKQERL